MFRSVHFNLKPLQRHYCLIISALCSEVFTLIFNHYKCITVLSLLLSLKLQARRLLLDPAIHEEFTRLKVHQLRFLICKLSDAMDYYFGHSLPLRLGQWLGFDLMVEYLQQCEITFLNILPQIL